MDKEKRSFKHLEIPDYGSGFIPLLRDDEGKRTPPPPQSVLHSPSSGDYWNEVDITKSWTTNVFTCGLQIRVSGISAIREIPVHPSSLTSFMKSFDGERFYVNHHTQLMKTNHFDIDSRVQSGTAKYIYSNRVIIGCYDRTSLVFYYY